MKCSACGTEFDGNFCPNCGYSAKATGNQKKQRAHKAIYGGTDTMSRCKACGQRVSLSARRCPHCDARVLHPIFGVSVGMIALLVVLAFVAFLPGSDALPKPPSEGQSLETQPIEPSAPSYISVSATDLWAAYSDNKVNADNIYKGQLLAVTGTITDIGQDLVSKAPCVSLSTGDAIGLYAVQCFFPKNGDQTDLIAALSDGDTITIYGTCSGTPIMQVQLSSCYLAE